MRTPFAWLRQRLSTASSRAAAADVYPHERTQGISQSWTPTSYGAYYATSTAIYSAIKARSDALLRAPIQVFRKGPNGVEIPVPPDDYLRRIFDHPNDDFTIEDLIEATEINLSLWGRAHWSLEIADGRQLIWPLRPDRLVTLPGTHNPYIAGYVYWSKTGRQIPYLPEEIVTFSYFNPLQDRTGLAPIAPLRLVADMAHDAAKYNRETFRNGGIPDYLLFPEGSLTTQQIHDFYERWESRYQGTDKAHRPAIAEGIRDMKTLAFSQREMEFIEGLKWSVEDAARVYGVPEAMLGRLENATLANIESLERIFWRLTMIGETQRIESKINNSALPKLGFGRTHVVRFDLSAVDVLTENEEPRLQRETEYLDRGVLSINEVRRSRGLLPIVGGDDRDAPARRRRPPAPTRGAGDARFSPHAEQRTEERP